MTRIWLLAALLAPVAPAVAVVAVAVVAPVVLLGLAARLYRRPGGRRSTWLWRWWWYGYRGLYQAGRAWKRGCS